MEDNKQAFTEEKLLALIEHISATNDREFVFIGTTNWCKAYEKYCKEQNYRNKNIQLQGFRFVNEELDTNKLYTIEIEEEEK